MTQTESVARAFSCLGQHCAYELGKGGFDPALPFPWKTGHLSCDCSGFVAWCLGVGRHTDHPWYKPVNGGWLETSAIYRDATTPGYGMFDEVPRDSVGIGDLVVYGDFHGQQGHVTSTADVEVIHCSNGAWKIYADAISKSPPTHWLTHGGIYVRYVEFSGKIS